MKKLFKLTAIILALIMVVTSLVSCDINSRTNEQEQGNNKNIISNISGEIYIFDENTQIEPHSVFCYSTSYNAKTNQWISASGMGMGGPAPEYILEHEDDIPAVNSKNVTITLSSNGKLSCAKIYRKSTSHDTYELVKSLTSEKTNIFSDIETAFSSLPEGTYCIVLNVSFRGNSIGGQHESSGYEYCFKIIT